MGAFVPAVLQASTAFVATNIDDLFILMLLFSRLQPTFRAWQVVSGQFVGIAALVAVSLLSLLGRVALPEGVLGLLGLFPISLGLSQLAETFDEDNGLAVSPDGDDAAAGDGQTDGVLAGILAVSALTIANGSDNISVYMAMLANSDPFSLQVVLGMFALLTGLWCWLAWWLTQTPVLVEPLKRFRRDLAPVVLMVIGLLVLHGSRILAHPPLAAVALACVAVMLASLIRQLSVLLAVRPWAGAPDQ